MREGYENGDLVVEMVHLDGLEKETDEVISMVWKETDG